MAERVVYFDANKGRVNLTLVHFLISAVTACTGKNRPKPSVILPPGQHAELCACLMEAPAWVYSCELNPFMRADMVINAEIPTDQISVELPEAGIYGVIHNLADYYK